MKEEIKLFIKTAISEEFYKLKSFLENTDISRIKITFGNTATEIDCIENPKFGIFYRDRRSNNEPFHIWIQSYWDDNNVIYNLNLSGIENHADTEEIYLSFCIYISRQLKMIAIKLMQIYFQFPNVI